MKIIPPIFVFVVLPFLTNALTLDLATINYPLRINTGIEYVVDVEHDYDSFDSLTFSKMEKGKGLNIGHKANSALLRFYLESTSTESEEVIVEIAYGLLDYVNFYVIDNKSGVLVKHITSGDKYIFSKRDLKHKNFLYPLKVNPDDNFKIYIHVKSEGTILIPLNIWKSQPLLEYDRKLQFGFGIYYGVMVAMILYNLFLAVSLKDKTFFIYVCYIISFITMMMTLNGYAHELLFGNYPTISNVACPISIGLTFGFLSYFAILYLKSSKHFRVFHYVLVALMTISFSVAILSAFLPYTIMVKVASILAFLIPIAIFIGLVKIVRIFPPAKYFVLALVPMLAGVFIYSLKDWGVLPMNFFTIYAIQIGSAMEVILLSLGLANKINYYRLEKEQAQKEAIANLRKVDKLKDQFLSNTAHELRTPLNAIIGGIENFIANTKDKVSELNWLVLANQNARRLFMLVNDIVDIERAKDGNLSFKEQSVQIEPLIRDIVGLHDDQLSKKNIKVSIDLEKIEPIKCDASRAIQIFENIVSNAIKYNVADGSIAISANNSEGKVEVYFADTGIGIPEINRSKIFDRFEKYGDQEGLGIGLNITKRLLDGMNGSIEVLPNRPQGSIFKITFEKSHKPLDEIDLGVLNYTIDLKELPVTSTDTPPTKRILVIDDDEANHAVIKGYLKDYELTHARSGIEGLEMIETDKPDLVLLDIMMPELNGLEVCKRIRKRFESSELPIIFQTCKNTTSDLEAGFQLGGNDYIPKPFSQKELNLRVSKCLETISQSKRIPPVFQDIIRMQSDIVYMTYENRMIYCFGYTNKTYVRQLRSSIKDICERLEAFVQINANETVNLLHVEDLEISRDQSKHKIGVIRLKGELSKDKSLQVSKSFLSEFQKKIELFEQN